MRSDTEDFLDNVVQTEETLFAELVLDKDVGAESGVDTIYLSVPWNKLVLETKVVVEIVQTSRY